MTLFKNNKYHKWYYNIIENAKSEKRYRVKKNHPKYRYYEQHHIIPKSIGGSNDKDNLILLLPKEHFICHLLLIKMVIDDVHKEKMMYALHMTMNMNHVSCNSKLYEEIRLRVRDQLSKQMKGKPKSKESIQKMVETRRKNGSYKHSKETRDKMSKTRKGVPQSPELIEKRASALRGRKQSSEHIAKLSAVRKGRIPWNKGKTLS